MTTGSLPRYVFALLASTGVAMPLSAENTEAVAAPMVLQAEPAKAVALADPLARFAPSAERKEHRIDYSHWDEALEWFVIPMGPSLREGATRATPGTGTRFTYGHTSRYRLEGNRVAFSFFSPDILSALTDYRLDLERVGSELDLTRLPRNEQLAYWINLHNVAVIEAIAREYPMRTPAERAYGANQATLQDARLVTVAGVQLSPRDIREKIVYPNWSDPRVIYAFWRGEIGGPSLQRVAYTGANVDFLLSLGAEEFVNSLRGVEAFGGALQVSKIYEEAQGFYFPDQNALRAHLLKFAHEDVKSLIAKKDRIAFNRYEGDIADLLYGRGDPGLTNVCLQGRGAGTVRDEWGIAEGKCDAEKIVVDRAARQIMFERAQKLNKAYRRGIRTGTVTVAEYDPDAPPKEVE